MYFTEKTFTFEGKPQHPDFFYLRKISHLPPGTRNVRFSTEIQERAREREREEERKKERKKEREKERKREEERKKEREAIAHHEAITREAEEEEEEEEEENGGATETKAGRWA